MTGFYPNNQNTLYLLHLFYSDNEIINVHDRPAICTLIGWIETSCLCLSFIKVSWSVIQLIHSRESRHPICLRMCVGDIFPNMKLQEGNHHKCETVRG